LFECIQQNEALARAQGRGADHVTMLLTRDLRIIFPEDERRGESGLENWHMYAAGAAKAALADRLATDWQARIAAGATLDDVGKPGGRPIEPFGDFFSIRRGLGARQSSCA
jgi:hypothetical protein